ncbi:MAG TPA: VOC family protein [Saprospiraceae bacterium]|nr:VOC family protein [Saprospiraceae bacterium]HPN69954.1 VOC family protein [Saprospiraceae bacterium]
MDNIAGKIIGIGGIFFKTSDTENTKKWYNEHLGVKVDDWGAPFVQKKVSNPDEFSFLQWSPMPSHTQYFFNDDQQFMINYRVENIEALINQLIGAGCEILDELQSFDYGKFIHIRDIDGRAIELWEPIDAVFVEMYNGIDKVNFE